MIARPAVGEFCWIDLKTRDIPATAAFFSAALGWSFAVDPDDWRQATKIAVDGRWIGGVSDLASPVYPPGTPPHIASYLAVDDVAARAVAAQRAGAEIVVPPSDVADQGRMAALVDPFGAAVALWQAGAFGGWTRQPGRMFHFCDRPVDAERFYEHVLGMPAGAAGFAVGDPAWEVAVGAPDPAAVARRVRSLGAGTCTGSHLVDPQGLRIAIVPA